MTKQPVLTGFPHTVFATAKRRAQAAIQALRKSLISDSLSGYALIFESVLPAAFLSKIDPTDRDRHFGHLPVFWAWLGQILEGNASCTKGLSMIQSWCRVLKLPVPASDTSGYCRARTRINDRFLDQVGGQIKQVLEKRIQPRDSWRGHSLKAIDGTSVTLMDTLENQIEYPQHTNSKEGCGFPIMGIVGMVNLSHGGVEGFQTSGFQKHDARIAPSLLKYIDEGDIVLGDRAFCSYEFISRITIERKGHAVMRLHQARHRKLDWRKGKKISQIERLVTWKKPTKKPDTSQLTDQQWEDLPNELTLRYIKLGYENRAGEKAALVVVTDLLDPQAYPAEEVADLYMERWQIEVKFRDLKTTLGMDRFAVKTPAMGHKTLKMMVIAYNLLRATMQEAAQKAGKKVHEMSVRATQYSLTSSHETFRGVTAKPLLKKRLYDQLLDTCAEHQLDIRPFRQEPRAIKRRPKNYQLLTAHRRVFKEVQHRATCYRKKSPKNA
ncbi:IS4 family transposase [Verrucomicrobiaceae bacterium 227]